MKAFDSKKCNFLRQGPFFIDGYIARSSWKATNAPNHFRATIMSGTNLPSLYMWRLASVWSYNCGRSRTNWIEP